MPKAWSDKDERMYAHVIDSCSGNRPMKVCKRMAAATVNKHRRTEGRTLDQAPGDTPLWLRLALGAGAGAAAGTLVWLLAKKELERDFGQGAERLQTRLERSGTALRAETRELCADAAEAQVRAELASIGITRGLVSDARGLIRRIDAFLP